MTKYFYVFQFYKKRVGDDLQDVATIEVVSENYDDAVIKAKQALGDKTNKKGFRISSIIEVSDKHEH